MEKTGLGEYFDKGKVWVEKNAIYLAAGLALLAVLYFVASPNGKKAVGRPK